MRDEADAVVEVPRRVVGPTASPVDSLVGILPSHAGKRLSNCLVLDGRIEFDAILVSCVLPVGSEVEFLQMLHVARRGTKPEPIQMRAGVPVVVVVVQVRRGRDKKVHASRFEVRVAVEERPLKNPPVLPSSRIAGIAIPSGIVRHLENLAHHRLGYVVVVYVGSSDGRLAGPSSVRRSSLSS